MDKGCTNLALVSELVHDLVYKVTGQNIDKVIISFFRRYCKLSALNRCLNDTSEPINHQKYLLRVLFLKAILPVDILRSLHLIPPKGVSFDQWVCFAGPCASSDKIKCQDIKIIQSIRDQLGIDSVLDSSNRSFEEVWGKCVRDNSSRQQIPIGSFSPLLLFPTKSLPHRVKLDILRKAPENSGLNYRHLDRLFLCCDHFGIAKGAKLRHLLRSDRLFNYSYEYICEVLDNGKGCFQLGRKSWRTLKYLPQLISKSEIGPQFEDPNPVSNSTLAHIEGLKVFTMNTLSSSSMFNGGEALDFYSMNE